MIETFGYVASILVFVTFSMKTMVPLRLVALGSNVAFLIYGLGLNLKPVFILHSALLAINGWRLCELILRPSALSIKTFLTVSWLSDMTHK
jgi:hypothetical protein